MGEYTFLATSIVIAVLGVGLYLLIPVLERWRQRLDADVERLKQDKRLSDRAGDP